MTGSEKEAKAELQKIRPQAMPLMRIVSLYDSVFGSELAAYNTQIHAEFVAKLKQELDSDLEELSLSE